MSLHELVLYVALAVGLGGWVDAHGGCAPMDRAAGVELP